MTIAEQRREFCKLCGVLSARRLVSGVDGNVSIRLPGQSMLITPSGSDKGMLKPEMLLTQHFDGTVEGGGRSTREAAMHIAVYTQRAEAGAVIHTHSAYATVFAACGGTVPDDILIEIPALIGKIGSVPFAPPGSKQLADGVRKQIRESTVLLLQNHGVLAAGRNLAHALSLLDSFENAAKTIVLAELRGKAERFSQKALNL